MTAALVVFCATYLMIAVGKIGFFGFDRPAATIVGSVAMVAVAGFPLDKALGAVDLHVIALLFGVLVIAAQLREAQFFKLAAHHVLIRAHSARSLLFAITFVAGGLSALLVNDTVCVVLTPLVVTVAAEAALEPLPFLLALASGANIGGVVSFSGNPQNMIVGAAAHDVIGFAHYLGLMLPIGAVCLAANAVVLAWLFRHSLPTRRLREIHAPAPKVDVVATCKGLAALALFAGLALAGVSLAGAAMAAAAALLVSTRADAQRRAFAVVDWPLLAFFAGLFVVIAGVADTGALERLFDAVAPVVARGDVVGDAAFVAMIVLAANLVSNVPLVIVAVGWIPHMHDPRWGYVMLAAASTLSGNLTLFGSVANIIVVEGSSLKISFWRFLRYGAVITSISLALAFALLAVERAIGLL